MLTVFDVFGDAVAAQVAVKSTFLLAPWVNLIVVPVLPFGILSMVTVTGTFAAPYVADVTSRDVEWFPRGPGVNGTSVLLGLALLLGDDGPEPVSAIPAPYGHPVGSQNGI